MQPPHGCMRAEDLILQGDHRHMVLVIVGKQYFLHWNADVQMTVQIFCVIGPYNKKLVHALCLFFLLFPS